MKQQFARIFYHEKYGQILVVNDTDDGKPAVKVSYIPEDLGVCSTALKFDDTENGYDLADKAFEKMDIEMVLIMVLEVEKALGR